jgi:hypothetical protein
MLMTAISPRDRGSSALSLAQCGEELGIYSYVGNDPINFVDPLVLNSVLICRQQAYMVIVEQDGGGDGRGGNGPSYREVCETIDIPDHSLHVSMTPYPPTGGYSSVNIATPHDYVVNNKVASVEDCSATDMADGLSRHAVPGVPSTQPVQSGQPYIARDAGLPFSPGGWVRSTMQGSVHYRNQTLEGHPLHNGSVDRIAYQSGGDWYVATIGVGVNSSSLMALVNEYRGPAIFNQLDADLTDYLGSNCGGGTGG